MKKVEVTELFYDLVFVYAISQMTSLLEHTEHGMIALPSLLAFAVSFIILINSWMYQTVFTNRYGRYAVMDSLILFADMAILLFLSNSLASDLRAVFRPFCLALGLLSLSLLLQYALKYGSARAEADRRLIRDYIVMLAIRSGLILAGAVLPFRAGVAVALSGVLIGWVMPSFFVRNMRPTPVNFPHLVERLTLLVIITFGETIVGIASWFTLETLNLWSVLVFVIVVAMFGCYVIAFNKLIDEENDADTGVGLIYTHYPILLGVSFVTVSLSFLAEEEIRLSFSTLLLFIGMALFYTGILLNGKRNKERYRYPKSFWLILTVALLLGLAAGLLVGSAETAIMAGAAVASVFAVGNLYFYHKGIKINHGGN